MKKLFFFLAATAAMFVMGSCGENNDGSNPGQNPPASALQNYINQIKNVINDGDGFKAIRTALNDQANSTFAGIERTKLQGIVDTSKDGMAKKAIALAGTSDEEAIEKVIAECKALFEPENPASKGSKPSLKPLISDLLDNQATTDAKLKVEQADQEKLAANLANLLDLLEKAKNEATKAKAKKD